MKSVKAFSDWNLTSADSDSTFLTITGNNSSIISFEFCIKSFVFLAIDSRTLKRQDRNSSIVLFPGISSQCSNKYARTWIRFSLQIFDLKLLAETISWMQWIARRPPFIFVNYFPFLFCTFLIPMDLYESVFSYPPKNCEKLSLVRASKFGICVVLTVSIRQRRQH